MKSLFTPYGRLFICDHEQMFEEMLKAIRDTAAATSKGGVASIALSGGTTPRAFYLWCIDQDALKGEELKNIVWTVGDERCVPLHSSESNFGAADRLFLTPLGVPEENKMPWPVDMNPEQAADDFNEQWADEFGADEGFDLCFCGMGDDCHTLSLFPESELFDNEPEENFAAVDTTTRGWRLTLTPAGLERCGKIYVTVKGRSKARALQTAFSEARDERERPIQILARNPGLVTWLVDEEAASGLGEIEFFRAQLQG